MKYIFMLLILFCTSHVKAISEKLKIALVIALDNNEGKAFFNRSSYDVNQRIGKQFRKYFDPEEFDISVVKNANLSSVWKTLHDPTIHGVFFVGHAGIGSDHDQAMVSPTIIADQNMYNLKNAFQSVHANLRYLAFLSCNAQEIIHEFIKANYYSNAPDLRIKTFNRNVKLSEGLREIILDTLNPFVKKHDGLLRTRYSESSVKNNFIITRTLPANALEEDIQPTLIMANKRVLGFFDKAHPGAIQSISVSLTDEEIEEEILIAHESGAPSTKPKTKVVLGTLNMMSPFYTCRFQGLYSSKGELLGVGKNSYHLDCD